MLEITWLWGLSFSTMKSLVENPHLIAFVSVFKAKECTVSGCPHLNQTHQGAGGLASRLHDSTWQCFWDKLARAQKQLRNVTGWTRSSAPCLWPYRVPVPAHISDPKAHQTNAADPVFLLALTEWTETAILAQELYNEEAMLVAETPREAEGSSAQRPTGGEGKRKTL